MENTFWRYFCMVECTKQLKEKDTISTVLKESVFAHSYSILAFQHTYQP